MFYVQFFTRTRTPRTPDGPWDHLDGFLVNQLGVDYLVDVLNVDEVVLVYGSDMPRIPCEKFDKKSVFFTFITSLLYC